MDTQFIADEATRTRKEFEVDIDTHTQERTSDPSDLRTGDPPLNDVNVTEDLLSPEEEIEDTGDEPGFVMRQSDGFFMLTSGRDGGDQLLRNFLTDLRSRRFIDAVAFNHDVNPERLVVREEETGAVWVHPDVMGEFCRWEDPESGFSWEGTLWPLFKELAVEHPLKRDYPDILDIFELPGDSGARAWMDHFQRRKALELRPTSWSKFLKKGARS